MPAFKAAKQGTDKKCDDSNHGKARQPCEKTYQYKWQHPDVARGHEGIDLEGNAGERGFRKRPYPVSSIIALHSGKHL